MAEAHKTNRRQFMTGFFRNFALAATGGIGWGQLIDKDRGVAFQLRPPGAREETDFLATCIKCGQCVTACPYDTLSLGTAGSDGATGTPAFTPRENPCRMCPDIPCVTNCPTGALDNKQEIEVASMGLAVLIDQETCLAFQGLRCEVCYRVCPKMGKAISLEFRPQDRTGRHAFFLPVVDSDQCTGCGMCEHACVLEKAAIKVLPVALAKGQLGENYRFGWKEDARISQDFGAEDAGESHKVSKESMDDLLDDMDNLDGILEE